MAFLPNCVGMGDLIDTDESYYKLCAMVETEGNLIHGYGVDYYNYHFGHAQYILSEYIPAPGEKPVYTFDTHVKGRCVWNVRIERVISIGRDGNAEHMLLVSDAETDDAHEYAVVSLVNSEVLPDYTPGNVISMQVAAFVLHLDFFENRSEYIVASGHPDSDINDLHVGLPGYSQFQDGVPGAKPEVCSIRGTILGFRDGTLKFGGEEYPHSFGRIGVATEFGDIELIVDPKVMASAKEDMLSAGRYVEALCVIQGDVAIGEYADGRVDDPENHIQALRGVITGEDPERLRCILAEDCEYRSVFNSDVYKGPDDIIARLKYVQKSTTHEYAPIMAKCTDGRRCIAMYCDEPDNCDSLMFIRTDDQRKIVEISTENEEDMEFRKDMDCWHKGGEVTGKLMGRRANAYGLTTIAVAPPDVTEALGENLESVRFVADAIVDSLKESSYEETRDGLMSAMGYMFLKGLENGQGMGFFDVEEALAGKAPEDGERLGAYTTAMRFFYDYKTVYPMLPLDYDKPARDASNALVFLYYLGTIGR